MTILQIDNDMTQITTNVHKHYLTSSMINNFGILLYLLLVYEKLLYIASYLDLNQKAFWYILYS